MILVWKKSDIVLEGLTPSHLSLSGVHVNIDMLRGHGDSKVHEGVCVLGQDVLVGRLYRLLYGSALDESIVNKEDEIRPLRGQSMAVKIPSRCIAHM